MRRTHPFNILIFTKRFLPLLILPLLRSFVLALQGNLYYWLRGSWFDIFIITLIFLLAFTRWYFIKYKFDNKNFTLVSGLIRRERVNIPFTNVISMFVEQPLLYRLFGVARISTKALSKPKGHFDIRLVLSKKDALSIMKKRQAAIGEENYKTVYMPRPVYITVLALLTSNSFSGIILFFALISQLFNFFGEQLRTYILVEFQALLNVIYFGVPPVLNLLTWVIVVGYVFGFITNFLNNKDFIIKKGTNTLYINSGFTTLSDYSVTLSEIYAIDIRQNLLSKIFKLYTVQIQTAGYGSKGTKMPILIPAARYSELLLILEDLFPEMLPSYPEIRPDKNSILKFINAPLLFYLFSIISYFVLKRIFPSWGKLVLIIVLVLFIFATWFFIIRLLEFYSAGISKSKNVYTINFSKKLILHSKIFPIQKLSYFSFRQTPLQKRLNKADLLFYSYSENNMKNKVKNLPISQLKDFFS